MEKFRLFNLPGTLGIDFEGGKTIVQFTPDDPDSVDIDSYLFEGTGQLLRNGQFEFVLNHCNKLSINQL